MKYGGQVLRLAYWMDSHSRSRGIEHVNQTLNQVVWHGEHKSNLKKQKLGMGLDHANFRLF